MMEKFYPIIKFLFLFWMVLIASFHELHRTRLKISIEENRQAFLREMARLKKNPKNFRYNRWGRLLERRISDEEAQCENNDSIKSLKHLLVSYASAIKLIEQEVHHKVMGHNQVSVL